MPFESIVQHGQTISLSPQQQATAQTIASMAMNAGYTPAAAMALVTHAMEESSLNPTLSHVDGYDPQWGGQFNSTGLFQMNRWRLDTQQQYASSLGLDPMSAEGQTAAMLAELDGTIKAPYSSDYASLGAALKSTDDPVRASGLMSSIEGHAPFIDGTNVRQQRIGDTIANFSAYGNDIQGLGTPASVAYGAAQQQGVQPQTIGDMAPGTAFNQYAGISSGENLGPMAFTDPGQNRIDQAFGSLAAPPSMDVAGPGRAPTVPNQFDSAFGALSGPQTADVSGPGRAPPGAVAAAPAPSPGFGSLFGAQPAAAEPVQNRFDAAFGQNFGPQDAIQGLGPAPDIGQTAQPVRAPLAMPTAPTPEEIGKANAIQGFNQSLPGVDGPAMSAVPETISPQTRIDAAFQDAAKAPFGTLAAAPAQVPTYTEADAGLTSVAPPSTPAVPAPPVSPMVAAPAPVPATDVGSLGNMAGPSPAPAPAAPAAPDFGASFGSFAQSGAPGGWNAVTPASAIGIPSAPSMGSLAPAPAPMPTVTSPAVPQSPASIPTVQAPTSITPSALPGPPAPKPTFGWGEQVPSGPMPAGPGSWVPSGYENADIGTQIAATGGGPFGPYNPGMGMFSGLMSPSTPAPSTAAPTLSTPATTAPSTGTPWGSIGIGAGLGGLVGGLPGAVLGGLAGGYIGSNGIGGPTPMGWGALGGPGDPSTGGFGMPGPVGMDANGNPIGGYGTAGYGQIGPDPAGGGTGGYGAY